jgi:hypothetical protein
MPDVHWTLFVIAAGVAWAALAWWRPGSVALAVSWLVAQVYYFQTGDSAPVELYRALDVVVVCAIFLQARLVQDWLILLIFPVQWMVYTWDDPVSAWWTLWALAIVQMVCAGPWPSAQKIKGSVSHGLRGRHVGET